LIMYTSFSRTLSAMRTLVSPMPLLVTSAFARGRPRLESAWVNSALASSFVFTVEQ
jgi:hypothetical protein